MVSPKRAQYLKGSVCEKLTRHFVHKQICVLYLRLKLAFVYQDQYFAQCVRFTNSSRVIRSSNCLANSCLLNVSMKTTCRINGLN